MSKTCQQCAASFQIFPEDEVFLQKLSPVIAGKQYLLPEPEYCSICRQQNRLATRNERTLYHRNCDATGKKIISCFAPECKHPVYENEVWWSDQWNAPEYGRPFDFSRSFFEQFAELRDQVPRMARQQQEPIENCDYSNGIGHSRNCYLMSSTNNSEDCCYGMWVNHSRSCIDCYVLQNCELCYECVNCRDCYDLRYSEDCIGCHDSAFLINCIGCAHCFGSSGLQNKKYVLFNEQLSREEYEQRMKEAELDISRHSVVQKQREKMQNAKENMKVKYMHGVQIENSSGDYVRNCKNAFECFDCDDCEDMRYCVGIQSGKVSMDHTHWGANSEAIYNCQACGYDVYNLKCCFLCWGGSSNLLYCDHCFSARNCFGCVGLKNAEYCIFNTQYTKEEYEEQVSKIIAHMQQTGEWGKFFPVQFSTFAYNETIAQEYFPLSRQEVLDRGWNWKEIPEPDFSGIQKKIPANQLPEKSQSIPDDILNWAIVCSESKRLFRIQRFELDFYRNMNLPIPRLHPDIRHRRRFALRNPRFLVWRKCSSCQKDVCTTYTPESLETVYCEQCYLQEVY